MAKQQAERNGEVITPEDELKAAEIETAVQSNISACYLKLEDYNKAIVHANLAITLNSSK